MPEANPREAYQLRGDCDLLCKFCLGRNPAISPNDKIRLEIGNKRAVELFSGDKVVAGDYKDVVCC
jgi:hypothetical protein